MKCLAYLVQRKSMGITYEHGDCIGVHSNLVPNGTIEMYTDASFAEDVLTRHSTSGCASVKNRGAITWGSKGQSKVALSTGDAELRALAKAFVDVRWLRKLVRLFADPAVRNKKRAEDDDSEHDVLPPTVIWEDNKSTISWVDNPVAHEKTKHIDVPLKALREAQSEHKTIKVKYIKSHLQLADGLTKNLSPTKHYAVMAPLLNWPQPERLPSAAASA